jgi:hypothetical protein
MGGNPGWAGTGVRNAEGTLAQRNAKDVQTQVRMVYETSVSKPTYHT